MKKIIKFFIPLFVFLIIVSPVALNAQNEGLVPCGKGDPVESESGTGAKVISDECRFEHILILINEVIEFALFKISIPLAAIMFAYAGISLITAGSAEGKTTAKNVFSSTVIGLVIATIAYLVVKTLLTILGYDSEWI